MPLIYLVNLYSIKQYIANLLILENILCTFPSKNPISAFDLSHCNRNVNEYIVYLQLKFKLFLFMCIGLLPLTSYLWSFFILISAYALLLHVLLTFK